QAAQRARVPRDALRHRVLDLRGVRRGEHRAPGARGVARVAQGPRRVMGLSPFALCVVVLVTLAARGLPIGLSMIGASIVYLFAAGLDPGTAAEQILNGL